MNAEKVVYKVFNELNITFVVHEHPPVYTVEEAQRYASQIEGMHCKNLFLRNKKGSQHYLLTSKHDRSIKLDYVAKSLGEKHLSFASEERLFRYLGVKTGSVSPLALINDKDLGTILLIDNSFQSKPKLNFHPNVNDKTVTISFEDFMKFINHCGNRFHIFQF